MLSWLGLREPFERLEPADFNVCFKGSHRPSVTVGEHSYANRLRIYCWRPGLEIRLGKFCSIAEDVSLLLGGEHDLDWVSTYPFYERWALSDPEGRQTLKSRGDIEIGHDVWIGHGSTILSGTRIGTGAVIGAGCVLRGAVEPYAIMAGNPARLIRYRFPEALRVHLLASRWWELPEATLINLAPYLHDAEQFLLKIARTDPAPSPVAPS